MRPRFGYLHVPKTAGSSATAAIRAAAGRPIEEVAMDRTLFGDFAAFDDLRPEVRRLVHPGDPSGLADHDVLIGHFALSTFDAAGFARDDLAMLLREPRARLLSLYTFWRGWTSERHDLWAPYGASAAAADHDFAGFLEDVELAAQVDNVALRLLLSPHPLVPADAFIAEEHIEELIAEGSERLASLGFVATVDGERPPWTDLSTWLDVGLEVPRVNATAALSGPGLDIATALSPAALRSLTRRTVGDRALWDRAADRADTDVVDLSATADAAFARQIAATARPAQPVLEPSSYAVTDRASTLTWDDVAAMERIGLNLGGRENCHPQPGYEGLVAVDLYPATSGWNVAHDLRTPMPLPDGSVERIHTEDFLEHLEPAHILEVLIECRRLLRPGGRLRIACPDYENPKDRHAFEHCVHDVRNPEHITRTDRAFLEALLVEAGYDDYRFLQYWEGDRFVRGTVDYSVGMVRRTPDNDPRCRRSGAAERLRGFTGDVAYALRNARGLRLADLRVRLGRSLHVTSVIVDVTR